MAKIRKRKLKWAGSESPQIVGYKLYWEVGGKVTYESQFALLGTVTEVVLPDDVEDFKPKNGPIEFGIAAVDEVGNESDLITISAPYQFNVPQAPGEIWMEGSEQGETVQNSLDEISDELSKESLQASLNEISEELSEGASESDPLSFLEDDFNDETEAIIHRLPDNVVGKHSSEKQQDNTMALKRQVDKL